jgi:hypothetical protein
LPWFYAIPVKHAVKETPPSGNIIHWMQYFICN